MEGWAKIFFHLLVVSLAFSELVRSKAVPVTRTRNLMLQEPKVFEHASTRASLVSRAHQLEEIKTANFHVEKDLINSLAGMSISMVRSQHEMETRRVMPLVEEEWTSSLMTTQDQERITATLQIHSSEEYASIVNPCKSY